MANYWQYQIPLWLVAFLLLISLLIPMEAGLRLGKKQWKARTLPDGSDRGDVALNSMLALLGLMLAFTFSFTMGRAELRRQALIGEVNALGTTFLRADLLPEPGRTRVKQRLYEYAQSRYVKPGTRLKLEELQQLFEQSEQLQAQIWPELITAFHQTKDVTPAEKALLISAVNEVLDANARRTAVFWDRLPTAVLLLLLMIAGISMGVASFHASLSGHVPRWRMSALAVILAALMYVILDYDMVVRGLIQVDHQSMLDLVRDMQSELGVK
jgi:hypothetical protein